MPTSTYESQPESSPLKRPESGTPNKLELNALLLEREARKAIEDLAYWITEATETKDEQDQARPYKPFPKHLYLLLCLRVIADPRELSVYIYKSRTMMMSWLVSAYAAHTAFNNPATKVVFQSQDHDRAIHDIQCTKTLWERSGPRLRQKWLLAKPVNDQPFDRFRLQNGSELVAIPGDPHKIKSEHPTIYIQDESSIIERGEEALNEAVATRCPKIICLSSASPGWFADMYEASLPADWPEAPPSMIGSHIRPEEWM